MTNPLERAARALCLADGLDPDRKFKSSDWSEGTAPHECAWHEYLPKARAVLEAIRDVDAGSPAMLVAGKESLYSCSEDPELEDARQCFHAMIDAALKDG